jgi:hypothetical protein
LSRSSGHSNVGYRRCVPPTGADKARILKRARILLAPHRFRIGPLRRVARANVERVKWIQIPNGASPPQTMSTETQIISGKVGSSAFTSCLDSRIIIGGDQDRLWEDCLITPIVSVNLIGRPTEFHLRLFASTATALALQAIDGVGVELRAGWRLTHAGRKGRLQYFAGRTTTLRVQQHERVQVGRAAGDRNRRSCKASVRAQLEPLTLVMANIVSARLAYGVTADGLGLVLVLNDHPISLQYHS